MLRVAWNEAVWTCRDSFHTKKYSNLSPKIFVEWIAPWESRAVHDLLEQALTSQGVLLGIFTSSTGAKMKSNKIMKIL